jgi:hypothetical protein
MTQEKPERYTTIVAGDIQICMQEDRISNRERNKAAYDLFDKIATRCKR